CTAYRHLVLAPTQPGHCSRPVLFLDRTHPHGGQPRLEGRLPVRAEQQGQVTVDEGPVQVALTGAPFEEDLPGGAMGLGHVVIEVDDHRTGQVPPQERQKPWGPKDMAAVSWPLRDAHRTTRPVVTVTGDAGQVVVLDGVG